MEVQARPPWPDRLPCGKWALAQLAPPLVLEVSFPGKHHSWRKLIKVTPREQDVLTWQKTDSGLQVSELLSLEPMPGLRAWPGRLRIRPTRTAVFSHTSEAAQLQAWLPRSLPTDQKLPGWDLHLQLSSSLVLSFDRTRGLKWGSQGAQSSA